MFSFKGINFRDMNLRIIGEVEYTSTVRDITVVKVPGRNGEVYIDNGRYESVERGLKAVLDLPGNANIEDSVTRIHNWLVSDPGEHELTLGNDRDFVYRAVITDKQNITRLLRNYGRAVLRFRIHPIKYMRGGLEVVEIRDGAIINNPYPINAEPRITVRGDGEIIIKIGEKVIDLRDVDEGIILDSEIETAFSLDGERTQFDKVYSFPFPVLKPGDNVLTIPNNVSVSMIPRLGALV